MNTYSERGVGWAVLECEEEADKRERDTLKVAEKDKNR